MIGSVQTLIRDPRFVRSPDLGPVLCILAAVLIANSPALFHVVTANPLVVNADLVSPRSGWLPGSPFIDPNAGYTMQALGHLSALDWLHGHVPWWNPYEGLGAPLAGEMQSGAFFPLTILLALHQGVFVLQLVLEAVTGWSTYFLVRKLGVGRALSTAAGLAFGLCGTYAWLAHAPIRPVALLPLCLLGVERILNAATEGRRGGWQLLAIALSLSILAGFPETTFIDALFVAWWFLLRLIGAGRPAWLKMVIKMTAGVIVGVALSAPLIVAFAGYLPYANIGTHNGTVAYASLPSAGLAQLTLPYSLGPILALHSTTIGSDTLSTLWGNVGGYLTVTLIAAALVGVVGRRLRVLRMGLGSWIAVCLLRTFGFSPVVHAMAVLPGVRETAFFRYAAPTWELAVVLLAALGLDDIARAATPRIALVAAALVVGALAAWGVVATWPLVTNAAGSTAGQGDHRHTYALGSLVAAFSFLALLAVGGVLAGRRSHPLSVGGVPECDRTGRIRTGRIKKRGRFLMAGAVSTEAVLLLGFTYLSAPAPTSLQAGSVRWLQGHMGDYRFVTLGPIQPDYGSYFGIAEANVNDLPTVKTWTNYVHSHLDSNAPVNSFTSLARMDPSGPTPAQELSRHLSNYEAMGVRYVVVPASGTDVQGKPFPAPASPRWPTGPRLVYRDGFAEIWELPTASQVFSLDPTATPGSSPSMRSCTVTTMGWDRATVRCPHPAIMVRRLQYLPGWRASINGASEAVQEDRQGPPGLLQEVSVPAGDSTVSFTYLPPHEGLASVGAAVAALALLGPVIVRRARRRASKDQRPR